MSHRLDLGHGHTLSFSSWKPDRILNPQYAALPDVERYGALVRHQKPDGANCTSAITFDGPVQRLQNDADGSYWRVEAWEPLTLSPSLLCHVCGDHGWIRDGKWVPA